MTVPARLLRAYRATAYTADGITCRIGCRCSGLTGVFVTAWNPLSRRMPEGWNQRMQAALATRLRRWPLRDATGALGTWREAHFLAGAPLPVVLRLARVFRQNAIVVVARGKPARLVWLR